MLKPTRNLEKQTAKNSKPTACLRNSEKKSEPN